MSTFWIVAAALTLAVVGVLAVPLLRRGTAAAAAEQARANVALFHDQLAELERDRSLGVLSDEQFEQARVELARRLLTDVGDEGTARDGPPARTPAGAWRFAALACVPIAAVAAYLALGTPEALDPALRGARQGERMHPQNLEQMVAQLAQRLQEDPDDPEAWVLLARSLQLLNHAPEAVKAFARAIELIPDAPQLYADYADVLVRAADGEWTPAASAALEKALALDGSHPKALWLAGMRAYARGDYQTAVGYWEKVRPMAEQGSEVARLLDEQIAEARSRIASASPAKAGAGPAAKDAPAAKPEAASPASSAITGTVALAPELAAEAKPDDTVFVFARAASGPKMPLAIRRIRVEDLPYRFTLDDSAAMAPGMTISAFPQVVVGARVSRSGDAARRPGDLEGYSAPVKPGTRDIEVRIDARVR